MWRSVLEGLAALPSISQGLLLAWLITMVSVPILQWLWGERARTYGLSLSVVLQAATVIGILVTTWGWRTTARVSAIIILLAWLAEFIGSHTGYPFGRYRYTSRLQPQLGHVPAAVPLAWLMMLPPAWAVSIAITGHSWGPTTVVVGALAFTAWDLFLDPQMVKWQLWIWESQTRLGHYFGIPWTNYVGWLLVSALVSAIALPRAAAWDSAQPALFTLYILTWVLQAIGQFVFWQLPGSALAGTAGMGTLILWALK